MRIAINTRFLLANQLEGIGRFTHEISRRLVERRPKDEFIFLFDRPFEQSFITSERIKGIIVRPPARHPLLWYLWFEWAIPFVLSKQKADVFISMDGYCSLRSSVPTVMVTHDIAHLHYPEQVPDLVCRYYNHFVGKYIQRAEQIVTVSNFCKTDISEHYSVPGEKITVACNAAHPGFHPLSEEEKVNVRTRYCNGKAYFFYLGAVHPRKNIVRLIEAFDQFKASSGADIMLLIGGRFAWQTGAIKTAWDASPYQSDIQFLGYLPDEELPLLFGAALALTYVSLFEGFGVPLLEAMYSETPILTSNVSSMPEVAGDAGLLVSPHCVDEITNGMLQLYNNESLRQQLIENGRKQRQLFNWEKATDIIEDAINRAISS